MADPELARRLLREAEGDSALCTDQRNQFEIWNSITPLWVRLGEISEAYRIAERIPHPGMQSNAFYWIANEQIQRGDLEGAAHTIGRIQDVRQRDPILASLASAQGERGNPAAALVAIGQIESDSWKKQARRSLGLSAEPPPPTMAPQPESIPSVTARQLQTEVRRLELDGQGEKAIALARKMENPEERAFSLFTLAITQFNNNRARVAASTLEETIQVSEKIQDPRIRAHILRDSASMQARMGELPRAEATFQRAIEATLEIEKEGMRDGDLVFVAEAQMRAGDSSANITFQMLLQRASSIQNPLSKANWLAFVAGSQWRGGDLSGARLTYQQALQVAHTISHPGHRSHALGDIASKMADSGDMATAQQVAAMISDERQKSIAQKNIADSLARAKDASGAFQTAETIRLELPRAEALGYAVGAQVRNGDVQGGLNRSYSEPSPCVRPHLLVSVAANLIEWIVNPASIPTKP